MHSEANKKKPAPILHDIKTDDQGFMSYMKTADTSSVKREENRVREVPKVRVIFMGTPDFAATVFTGLINAGYHVVAAYTKPDKPIGRKQKTMPSPVKSVAEKANIPVEQPNRFTEEAVETFRKYKPDLVVVAAYGKILPKAVLETPGLGCVNVHTSLLPKYRGAAPVQNALLQGDTETGVTLMLLDEGLDTGDILAQASRDISPDDTWDTLLAKLADDSVDVLLETLPLWVERKIKPKSQDEARATVCQLIEREDGRIFWNETAETIWNRFRGLTPWPGIFTSWKRENGSILRIKLVRVSIQRTNPSTERSFGEVFEIGEKIAIQTSEGLVFPEIVQPEGKSSMPIRDFINGYPEFLGARLG